MDMKKVKKGGRAPSGLPLIRIGRFLKKYGGVPKRKPVPQYPLPLDILRPYVKPVGYIIPPSCEQAIYSCRALQVLEYALNPERYNMRKAHGYY